MPYVAKWSDLPEVEILKGNFRRSASGLKGSVNKIRLCHPSETPVHHHAEEEQTVLMLSGEMDVVIDKDTIRLGPDQVCVIPAGVPHCFRSVAGEAEEFACLGQQVGTGFRLEALTTCKRSLCPLESLL